MSQLVQLAAPPAVSSTPPSGPLLDRFGRTHSDLRISVTDRCNIRCFYCMPEQGGEFAPVASLLSFREILRFVRVAVPLGIRKIRLTGGEPLLRPHIAELVASLAEYPGIEDLALTTNAVLLAKYADDLYKAGLRRLNIHLDTLDRERFRQISRRDDLRRVLDGIDAALRAGFRRIKLNAVAIKGLTEPDIVPLVQFARERGMEVRFIEFMPLDSQRIWSTASVLTADEILTTLANEFGPLTLVPDGDPRAPAAEYCFPDGHRVGVIASITRPFCGNCNRLRLTADGMLRYCLFAREETDVRHLLRTSGTEEALANAIRATVWQKWDGHDIHRASFAPPQRPMYSIGG